MSLQDKVQRDHFSAAIWQRGKSLFNEGAVGSLKYSQNGVSCVVIGSRGNKYRVSITASNQYIEYQCNCPYGFSCKHAAAVIFAMKAAQPARLLPISAKRPATSPQDSWLQQCQLVLEKQPTKALNTAADKNTLYYLLEEKDRQLYLNPVVDLSYRKEDELNLVPCNEYHDDGDVFDQKIAQLWESQYVQSTEQLINDDISCLMLQLALESGRLYDSNSSRSKLNAAPLLLGSSVPLDIHWIKKHATLDCELRVQGLPDAKIYPAQRPWYRDNNTLGPLESLVNGQRLSLLQAMPELPLNKMTATHSAFFSSLPTKVQPDIPELLEVHLTEARFELILCARDQFPALQLKVHYGDFSFDAGWHRLDLLDKDQRHEMNGQHYRITCDGKTELDAIRALEILGFKAEFDSLEVEKSHKKIWMIFSFDEVLRITRWQAVLPKLADLCEKRGWLCTTDASYRAPAELDASLHTEVGDQDNGWFSMALSLQVDGLDINSQELLQRWFAEGFPKQLMIQSAGQWHIIEMQRFRHLTQTLEELYSGEKFGEAISLPPYRVPMLQEFSELDERRAPNFKKLKKQLQNFKGIKPVAVPKKLNAQLRDYQQDGLNWLNFLQQHQLGGILADDMGLGKTLQTLALLQKLKSGRKLNNGCLIVAPTSLLWNWQSEAERFSPGLSVLILHGPERKEDIPDIPFYDLVVTSYGVLQRDIDILKQHCFDVIVLDEAQAIKNANAKTTRAARQLQGNMRLALTGTPLENHLGELWSIMDFALPNLLGKQEHFNRHYRKPIESEQNESVNQRLAQQVAPFMLRRHKGDVAKELPPKNVIVQHVHLEKDQRKLYEGIRNSMEKHVRQLFQEKGAKRSHIEFLDALLKLRQACIDPSLVKLAQAKKVKNSAKRSWLQETLPEMVHEGRRVLVFSQFVSMLSVIADDLNKAKIPFIKLTGASKNRGELVKQFQAGEAPIFLISLKAGGSGLNLTAADTVIHVDPWWNPAVEDQATDRAYRIGQDKTVFVYKLVAQGTVEEKIQALQADKKALADALFDGTQKSKLPKSSDELLALLG